MIIPNYSSIMRTKYWVSVLAVSVVLLAGSLAINPIAIADDDDDDDDNDNDDDDCSALADILNTLIPPLTSGQANQILILADCELVIPDVPPPQLDGTLLVCQCIAGPPIELCTDSRLSCPVDLRRTCDDLCKLTTDLELSFGNSCSVDSCQFS